MKVDQNPFPAHTYVLELRNPKVLIRPNQAESTKGKNVIFGEERFEPSKSHQETPGKKIPEDLLKDSTLGGKNRKRAPGLLRPVWSVTLGVLEKILETIRKKERPSFKELLAKYEKKGVIQKQKGRLDKVKDTKQSSSQV